MMRKLSLLVVGTLMLCGGPQSRPVLAQASQPTTTVPVATAPPAEVLLTKLAGMTLEEVIERGYEVIKIAETRGPDAMAAVNELTQVLATIRNKDAVNADVDFLAGRLNIVLGRPREAIAALTSYIESSRGGKEQQGKSGKGQTDWLAFKLLGDLYLEAKYYTMARDKYQRAIDLNPRSPEAHAGMARAELGMARAFKAVELAQKAIEMDTPNSPELRNPQYYETLARALLGNRKPDEAAKAATTAVELARENARRDPANANLLTELDTYEDVLEQAVKGLLTAFPEKTEEVARLARVKMERAEIAHLLSLHSILQVVQQGLDRSGANPPPALLLVKARLLLAVENPAEAVQILTDLLGRDPTNTEAKQLLEEMRGPQTAGTGAAPPP